MMYDTVLVPVDGSDESLVAAEEAVALTAAEGTVHALSVVENLPMYRRSGKTEKFESDGDEDRARAEDAAAEAADLIEETSRECATAVADGVPAREIVGHAEEVDADAIVLGKRGRSESAQDMLGSTTERVIRKAPTTVVSVPAEE
jgi:nucleotide-binding universal stress UspA family protein